VARRVKVIAPSHVHVGNVDINGGMGRLYGTLGFALEEPRLVVEVEEWDGVEVEGGSPRLPAFARLFAEKYRVGLRVRVLEEIPWNVGLGATTAEALAIGYAAAVLAGEHAAPEELAVAAGRSTVSALGLYTFKHGGFVVDGGFVPGRGTPPPLIFRAEVPGDIAVVAAIPETPRLREILELKQREDEVLASMPPMSEEQAKLNSWRVLMGVLPWAAEGDWASAARRLYELNARLGEYWSARQPGRYCCREVEEAVAALLGAGAWCACQSSWGPTVYGLVPREGAGEAVEALRARAPGRVWVTRVNNRGAEVRVS